VLLSKTFLPFKLRFLRKWRDRTFTLLDIGCGNHSPQIAKHWFPNCRYVGVDIDPAYGNDEADLKAIDEFVELDLSRDSLDVLPEADAILLAHVIEHLPNGEEVLCALCRKLKPGGEIFIETPAPRSLKLPHGRQCLNFQDDPTHVKLYNTDVLSVTLESCSVQVMSRGTRRNPAHLWLTPAMLAKEAISLIRYRQLEGPPLYDLLGFACYVHGKRLEYSLNGD
jgi:SAM-dependent methyltransferase